MASEDDFLFHLNDFGPQTPSTRAHDKSNSNNTNSNTTSSLLAGLNAFTPDDPMADMDSSASTANFTDQLALWTNANFSFDGPTGHALLLDDEKDEEAKREERERRDREEAARGGAAAASSSRRGESSRDGANANSTPLEAPAEHRQQQQQYFPQSSSSSSEDRRSGYPAVLNGHASDRRRAENDAAPNTTTPAENAFSGFNFSDSSKQQQPSSSNGFVGQDATASFLSNFNGANSLGGSLSPELLQAIAFQQILSGGPQAANANPLALASLFGGGAPQMPNGIGAGPGGFPPVMQNGGFQYQEHQQQPRSQQHAPPPPPQFAAAPGWGFGGGLTQVPHPTNFLANGGGARSDSSVDDKSNNGGDDGGDAPSTGNKKRRTSSKKNEESAAARQKREDQEEIAQALRDEMPPLELIDTGNPEADAEANRVAIEEDKRRRNTAASARFRIKKKQREQALEQAAKELERRVEALEQENGRLTTENGWLKSLITIRPSNGGSGSPNATFNPLAAAAAAAAANGMNSAAAASFIGTGMQPQRDTGLQPRGVGTPAGGPTPDLSRHVTPQHAGNKRARDE